MGWGFGLTLFYSKGHKMEKKRYLVNEDTGVIFNWNEHMAILPHMRECDEKGKQIVEGAGESGDDGDSLDDMHWQQLKAMVEEAGGEYTNKKEAIAFLRGE